MNTEFAVSNPERYEVSGLDEIRTPRILFFEWALLANRDRLRAMTNHYADLRLMVKTFKSSGILQRYADDGLRAIKASGIDEARCMAAGTGVTDILISFPCFGPDVERFLEMREDYPGKQFSVIAGNLRSAQAIAGSRQQPIGVFLDVDPGMHRTGVPFGQGVLELARQVCSLPGLEIRGLHVYDGHIHYSNQAAVAFHSAALMRKIDETVRALDGICDIGEVVTSSALSAASNLTAYREGGYGWRHTVSPGTSVLWDSNYNDLMPGAYDYAAAIATRIIDVIYTNGSHILTTDCGLKLGVPTDPGPIHVLGFQGYRHFRSNERHGLFHWLGIDRETGQPISESLETCIGSTVLVFPRHVCPTVNQYDWGYLVVNGAIAGKVDIDARDG